MTCDELKERLVDPASAGQGGHGAVVEHLNTCKDCRATAKLFGQVERLYSVESGTAPPPDLDHRVEMRLAENLAKSGRRIPNAALAGGAVGLVVIATIVILLLRRQPPPSSAGPGPAIPAGSRAVAPTPTAAGPADIERVGRTPIRLDVPALSPEEERRVGDMYDAAFLNSLSIMEGLDPFFPEDIVGVELAGPPLAQPRPTAVPGRPPESRDARAKRLLDWQVLSADQKARLEDLDRGFRARPEDQRVELTRRWQVVSIFSQDELAGLKRISSRYGEMDARRREGLKYEIRRIALEPLEARSELWAENAWARTLTGQERDVARKLLIVH